MPDMTRPEKGKSDSTAATTDDYFAQLIIQFLSRKITITISQGSKQCLEIAFVQLTDQNPKTLHSLTFLL